MTSPMRADDRQAILDLIAQYGYTYDNDVEGFVVMGIYREGKPRHTQRTVFTPLREARQRRGINDIDDRANH
jgi:hypothetical protein